jgi:hypothetical protein
MQVRARLEEGCGVGWVIEAGVTYTSQGESPLVDLVRQVL